MDGTDNIQISRVILLMISESWPPDGCARFLFLPISQRYSHHSLDIAARVPDVLTRIFLSRFVLF
jgi:hypothetical protein